MNTAPPPSLALTHAQATRLHTYVQAYRRYAFASFRPSMDRNNLIRVLQTIQGKVIEVLDQPATCCQLLLTAEEMTTLQTIVTALLCLYSKEPASTERSATLADLAALMARLKHS